MSSRAASPEARLARSESIASTSQLPADELAQGSTEATARPNRVVVEGTGGTKDASRCPACAKLAFKKHRDTSVWIQCDKCQEWYHWQCVAANPLDTIDNIDKWFCSGCISDTNKVTYKAAPRKSARATKREVNYANLHSHLPALADKWTKVLESKPIKDGKADGGIVVRKTSGELRDAGWIWADGGEAMMGGPVFVERDEVDVDGKGQLGMLMPPPSMTVRDVANEVGPGVPVEVMDVASQAALSNWTLDQWADYYHSPTRTRIRNVISLEISESPLGEKVTAPAFVRELDWVEKHWPPSMRGVGEYPKVQKYCLMSVAGCWTDWHVDFAGSSVYYHILKGSKVFYFIRPTPANLAAYERWSGNAEMQESTWLGDEVDTVWKVELTQGNTMIIPTGWIHAVYTPSDSIVIGGNFLHSLNIRSQLEVYRIEVATKVPRKFRFPFFVKLLWFVADAYIKRLREVLSPEVLKEVDTVVDTPLASGHATPKKVVLGPGSRATHLVRRDSTPALPVAASPPPPPIDLSTIADPAPPSTTVLPKDLPERIIDGLEGLSVFLLDQVSIFAKGSEATPQRKKIARDNVPWSEVPQPEALARHLRKLVLKARGKQMDELCFRVVEREETDTPTDAARTSKKRPLDDAAARELALKVSKFKNFASTSATGKKSSPNGKHKQLGPKAAGPKDDGEIILRQNMPVTKTSCTEQRKDPKGVDPERERQAQVDRSKTSMKVVRRKVLPDGSIQLETRTVFTNVELVTWKPDKPPKPPSTLKDSQMDLDGPAKVVKSEESGSSLTSPPSGKMYTPYVLMDPRAMMGAHSNGHAASPRERLAPDLVAAPVMFSSATVAAPAASSLDSNLPTVIPAKELSPADSPPAPSAPTGVAPETVAVSVAAEPMEVETVPEPALPPPILSFEDFVRQELDGVEEGTEEYDNIVMSLAQSPQMDEIWQGPVSPMQQDARQDDDDEEELQGAGPDFPKLAEPEQPDAEAGSHEKKEGLGEWQEDSFPVLDVPSEYSRSYDSHANGYPVDKYVAHSQYSPLLSATTEEPNQATLALESILSALGGTVQPAF